MRIMTILTLVLLFTLPPLVGQAAEVVGPTGDSALPKADAEIPSLDEMYGKEPERIADPIEPFNRAMFWFNDKLYFYALKPVARVYRVVPEPARTSVSNFFSNIATPVRFVNSLLQVRIRDAGTELGRFVVNSTVGILGLFDPAKDIWKKKDEDLGQTLGHYGVGSGFYLVLPVFGPSNPRDTVGMIGDYFLDPWVYVLDDKWVYTGVKTYDRINEISLDEDTYEAIKKQALDPYLFIRNAYDQRRQALIEK